MFAVNIENWKKKKYIYIFKKTLSLYIFYNKSGHELEKNI